MKRMPGSISRSGQPGSVYVRHYNQMDIGFILDIAEPNAQKQWQGV
jgi:hypothetical protein